MGQITRHRDMTRLESHTVEIAHSANKVFAFLSNFNNFQTLMPEQVTNWKSTDADCEFTISGMATIGMRIQEKTEPLLIRITQSGKVPFAFQLDVNLQVVDDNRCKGQLFFDADLNPMLKMMVEKPLGNFINLLADKLQTVPIN